MSSYSIRYCHTVSHRFSELGMMFHCGGGGLYGVFSLASLRTLLSSIHFSWLNMSVLFITGIMFMLHLGSAIKGASLLTCSFFSQTT